ncbi:hypothetical protein [Elizabethkingia miricola]|uniref:hypothetical protein n=1 Tax=Elizabethkingia miricola TaxID=172045 RepID=UPI00099ABADE|nr:hypothetical protein [Elizabethkingia miricola]OPC34591.1 hypothetical protein BAX99_06910 [Elizabethkingia miricola]
MPDKRLSREDMQRNAARESLFQKLQKLLELNFEFMVNLPGVYQALKNGNDKYSLLLDKAALKRLNSYLSANRNQFVTTLLNGIQEEWDFAQGRFWSGMRTKYGKTLDQVKAFETIKTEAETNSKIKVNSARKFFNEQKGGLTISNRIWLAYDQIPKEMDVMVQNAIKSGQSHDDLARNLQKYLKEPDKLFRKVKNKETGRLEWSKAAKDYHPGQGVYRSSFKNADRLARTEINRAYRYSEWLGYQNNDLIYGFEIRLSNNTENQCEVCKQLAGIYPKWFLWTGWHPQCRCSMIPIPMPQEDWKRKMQYRAAGKIKEFKPNFIESLPDNFVNYMVENSERILNAKTLPYWINDNEERLAEYL